MPVNSNTSISKSLSTLVPSNRSFGNPVLTRDTWRSPCRLQKAQNVVLRTSLLSVQSVRVFSRNHLRKKKVSLYCLHGKGKEPSANHVEVTVRGTNLRKLKKVLSGFF